MALKTAFISEHQTRLLGCAVGDHSQIQTPAEMSGALGSFSYADKFFYSKSNGKRLYRKKSRSKAKVGRKRADKVFPEECYSDTGKEQIPSFQCRPSSMIHGKTTSSSDFMKDGLSPTLRLSHSCIELKNVSDAKENSREEVHECRSSEISNFKNSRDLCQSVSSNNGHIQVPRSRANGIIAKKKRNNMNDVRRKDQSRMTWKKCQGSRNDESRRETMSLPDHANLDSISQTSSVPSQQAALSCDELAVMPRFAAKPKKAAAAAKTDEMMDIVELDGLNGRRNKFRQSKSNSWKATRGPWSKLYRRQRHQQPFPFQAQNFQSKEKIYSKDTSTFDPIHPWMKLPRVKPVEAKHLQQSMNEECGDATCSQSNIAPRIRHGLEFTQHQSSKKWIPVCKKNTSISEISIRAVADEKTSDILPLKTKEDTDLEEDGISNCVPEAPTERISSTLLSDNDLPSSTEQPPDKFECRDVEGVENCDVFLNHPFDSHFVEQAFVSSYRMQLASEGVHRTTGYPLAEFERLLFSATPTIDYAILSEKTCDGSLILCREQTPNISLHSVLDWYEEPGNYGLKVDVDRPHVPERCIADNYTTSFHAHFVPLLSAIQLFGHSYPSSSFCKKRDHLCGNPAIDVHDITKPVNGDTPSLLSSAELLFEFFESEQPQRRKPLHSKIVELASEGTSNNQVFGDPSKLARTNLVDLHPASWFSVAWYPIYRIPEGKMRAAFLTYHSLGYFVQRCTTNGFPNLSPLSLSLPVIGLQSYSAQAELWFSLNTETESSLGQMTSAVLKERLRTLEETANFFARGTVFKDRNMVTNRQPDYEFFMARRGKPLYL